MLPPRCVASEAIVPAESERAFVSNHPLFVVEAPDARGLRAVRVRGGTIGRVAAEPDERLMVS